MAGLASKLGMAAVLAILVGGIWAGVRPKPAPTALAEPATNVEMATKPHLDVPARSTTPDPAPPSTEVSAPGRAPAVPPAIPASPPPTRAAVVAPEVPATVALPGRASALPVTATPTPPAAAPRFTDRRDLVDRPPATFVDQRPLAEGQGATPPPAPAARPINRFEDQRQLVEDKKAVPPAEREPARTARPATADGCGAAEVATEPLEGGRMRVHLMSPCRAGQSLSLGYGGAVLVRRLNAAGEFADTLDLFAGATPLTVTFDDTVRQTVATRARDLDRVDKVAIIWSQPVDLDLHALEYGAQQGADGHVWAAAPATAIAARELALASGRGRGFLSLADKGEGGGDKVEVYTFFRVDGPARGPVHVMIDYATRGLRPAGTTCGDGQHARVRFESVTFSRGDVARRRGEIAARACGQPLDAASRFTPLPQQAVR